MVNENKLKWYHLFFRLKIGPLPKVWFPLVVVTLFSVFVLYLPNYIGSTFLSIPTFPFTVIGMALAIFFAFRNNAAYDRYWEGRKLWGQLFNLTRNLTTQIITLIPATQETQQNLDTEKFKNEPQEVASLIIGYAFALKHLLRNEDYNELALILSEEEYKRLVIPGINIPTQILLQIGLKLQKYGKLGWLHPVHLKLMHENITGITNIQGACERIKTTPVPWIYKTMIYRVSGLYCLLLPFTLVSLAGNLTPFIVCFLSYVFLALEHIGNELEDPFGLDPNDLPLDAYTKKIERAVLQQFGEVFAPDADIPKSMVVT